MKLKFTYRPQQSLWLKKLISSSLALGLLFNTTSTSFAGILSEDGRYETFEGTNITVDNILEEDSVDVEIEGNTMVNVANQKDAVPITKSYTVEGTNHIPLQGEYDGKAKPVIKGNTMYYNNDTGELTDTFIEGANLSLKSSFEDQLVTQEMVDSGQEKAENLGKYKVEYKITGKNKLNPEWFPNTLKTNATVYGVNLARDGDKIIRSGTATATYTEFGENIIDFLIDGQEYIREEFTVLGLQIVNYDGTYTYPLEKSFVVDKSVMKEIKLYYQISKDSVYSNMYTIPQIEEGSTATEYEPYQESTSTFYLNSPLLEGDTIEDVNGKATHVKRYNYINLTTITGFNHEYEGGYNFYLAMSTNGLPVAKAKGNIYNPRYPKVQAEQMYGIRLSIKNNINITCEYPTVALFKEEFTKNPLPIVYELDTPIYETISEESILIDSYTNGHLNLNTNIPVNKVDFIPTATNLNYLYPSTEYTVQFESDNTGKIDTVSLGNEVLYSNYSVNKGINRFNITTPSEISSTELILDGIGFNLSNLVVTEATDEIFDYFEGIKSVGQDDVNSHNIEIKVNNKNLFDIDIWNDAIYSDGTNINIIDDSINVIGNTDDTYSFTGANGDKIVKEHHRKYLIKVKPNTTYTLSMNTGGNRSKRRNYLFEYDINYNQTCVYPFGLDSLVNLHSDNLTFTTNANTYYIGFRIGVYKQGDSITYSNIQIEENSQSTNYTLYQSNILQIPLSEPLRSLPNGLKDRIIKRNGQWVVERNCGEVVLDGSEDEKWEDNFTGYPNCTTKRFLSVKSIKGGSLDYSIAGRDIIISDRYIWNKGWSNTSEFGISRTGNSLFLYNNKIDNVNDLTESLNKEPLRIVYQLAEPIYEPLNIDPTINLYLDITHISNNSNIPANMKVTVDRTINRATEAIELAKENPTIENISLARMWTNLLKESTLKDEANNQINDITQVIDLEIEKKTVSANVDVYVKSDNALSMTLSTNSITFDNYSGVNDLEKLNALEVTVHSSLPYDLNAYLETEIQNSDKSVTIDSNLLQIRNNGESDYKAFSNTVDKIILEEDCPSGNYNKHNVDLKMEGSNAYKADIFKTTIKFEAEQK